MEIVWQQAAGNRHGSWSWILIPESLQVEKKQEAESEMVMVCGFEIQSLT